MVRTWENGIPIIETGSYGTRYGVVDLERVSEDSVKIWIRGTPVSWHWRVTPDSALAALVERYAAEIRPRVERVIATAAEPLDRTGAEYALGRLIADAQRASAAADLALINNGGIRAAIDAGPITWGEAYNVHPFDNKIIRLHLTGAQIRRALEHAVSGERTGAHISGVTVRYDPGATPGSRIRTLTLDDGTALRDDAVYTIAVNDFLAGGEGDGYRVFGEAQRRDATEISDLDAFIAYVETLPQPLQAPAEPRFIPINSNDQDNR